MSMNKDSTFENIFKDHIKIETSQKSIRNPPKKSWWQSMHEK